MTAAGIVALGLDARRGGNANAAFSLSVRRLARRIETAFVPGFFRQLVRFVHAAGPQVRLHKLETGLDGGVIRRRRALFSADAQSGSCQGA